MEWFFSSYPPVSKFSGQTLLSPIKKISIFIIEIISIRNTFGQKLIFCNVFMLGHVQLVAP